MSFTSLFFVTIFFPAFTLIYFLMPGIKQKNIWLLLASLVFYAFGGLNYLVLIIALAAYACLTGRMIQGALDRAKASNPDYEKGDEEFMSPLAQKSIEKNKRIAKTWLIAGIVVLVIILAVFKYTRFILQDVLAYKLDGKLDEEIIRIGMPLGVSFYTFKLISYVSDVYNQKTRAGDFFHVLLYTVIFHQVTQGPISRYGELCTQFDKRKVSYEGISDGIWRFTIGLAKKTLIADHCGKLCDAFLPLTENVSYSVFGAYMGSLFYMMQLYLDFSAYSDMAIGLGEILGLDYQENFNYPYIASSVRDFWRRWHISLSSFFRDYVYIPLGGSRVGFGRLMLNLLAVWALTGLWHGASWNFILWGLYYFVFIVIENLCLKKIGKKEKTGGLSVITGALGHLYTLAVVFFGWVLFRITDFHKLWEVMNVLLGRSGRTLYTASEVLTLRGNAYFVILAVSFCTPLWKKIALTVRKRLHSSQHKEALEMQNLEDERQLHEQEEKDHELVEKFSSESHSEINEVKKQDIESHERMVTRLENRIKKRKNERVMREALFYGMRTIMMLIFLFVSILAMVGASYSPFLYNQF